mgnify:CR=1 FL=1
MDARFRWLHFLPWYLPHISTETLEFHYGKHHKTYVDKLNAALPGSEFEGKSLEEVVVGSHGKNAGLFNNAGQHYNHIHFWNWMAKDGGGKKMPGNLEKAIASDLGGFDKMRDDFMNAGATQFGSGWCWLAKDNATGKLEIVKTPNGENPVHHGKTAILGCDVWEHSYYIDYRNARPKYLEAFVDQLINWEYVEKLYAEAQQQAAA